MADSRRTRLPYCRQEAAACQIVLVVLFAIQLCGLQSGHDSKHVLADVQVTAAATSLDAASPGFGGAAIAEAGWLPLTSLVRKTTSSGSPTLLQLDAAVPRSHQFSPAPIRRALLDVRPNLDAAKYGRHAARATTIPPPAN